jgi:hypothetical protein
LRPSLERGALALLVSLALSASMNADDEVIARIGERRVTAAEVRVSRETAAANPRWLQGRSVEVACAAAEQEKFRQIVINELLERICALESCGPSDEETEPFRSAILKNDAQLRGLVDAGLQVSRAAARVYRGEAIEKVYEEAIKPQGRTLDDFRREVAMYRSLEVVERHLQKDHLLLARQQFERSARRSAIRALLRQRIEAAARAKNQSVEDAAGDYLNAMAARIGVDIIDSRFRMPSGREVFL